MTVEIKPFFDPETFSMTYVIWDPATKDAAVLDSVLDYDPAAGATTTASADKVIAFVKGEGLVTRYVLETHVHADHLSAAPYMKDALGGEICIGENVVTVQKTFGPIFNAGPDFTADGGQFDRLLADGDKLPLGGSVIEVLHTPGHTPACISYLVDDAVFVGDTFFMPDYGTARCDFPGGDAATLCASLRRIMALPDETRMFVCHDYSPGGRPVAWETSVAAQKTQNIHIGGGKSDEAFISMRTARDSQLSMPKLILPSVQVNMRAGQLPPAEENGVQYLKIPLNQF